MLKEVGPRSLLRAIFPETPSYAPIAPAITQDDGGRMELREALDQALATLPFTRGSRDSTPRARWKEVLELSYYGLGGAMLTRRAIALRCDIDPRYILKMRRAALIELRRNERVIQMLSAFFIHPQAQEAPSK